MRRASFLVTDDGSTPDKPLVQCFYCRAKVEREHEAGCVMRRRTVVLRAIVEFVAVEPESFTEEQIRFSHNDGTWCAGNLPDLLRAHHPDPDDEEDGIGCICDFTKFEFVREATEEDEERSALRVAELKD